MQYAYNDEELSEAEANKLKLEEEKLKFVDVGTKSKSKVYKQRVKGDDGDLETPISTPDIQAGRVYESKMKEMVERENVYKYGVDDSQDDGGKSSDIGADDDEEDGQSGVKRRKSGVDDIDQMDFAFDDSKLSDGEINSAVVYKDDKFVPVESKKEKGDNDNDNDNADEQKVGVEKVDVVEKQKEEVVVQNEEEQKVVDVSGGDVGVVANVDEVIKDNVVTEEVSDEREDDEDDDDGKVQQVGDVEVNNETDDAKEKQVDEVVKDDGDGNVDKQGNDEEKSK